MKIIASTIFKTIYTKMYNTLKAWASDMCIFTISKEQRQKHKYSTNDKEEFLFKNNALVNNTT